MLRLRLLMVGQLHSFSHPFPPISDQEIAWVCGVMRLPPTAFSGADGADPRLAVMRSLETLDVEACPGSGKTTLLVAKLAILANRWRSKGQGICVLSHTNAARAEIGDRLGSTSAGHLLLQHPHFIGTIHSFVNEFLALPWLRSKGWPIKSIDNDIALNDRWYRLPINTRGYLEKKFQNKYSLNYTTKDFTGGGKDAHGPETNTHRLMLSACKNSTEAGYYCFDEMFIWADELIEKSPEVISTLRQRFPLVFIDEVQDNSELQSAFLHRLFMAGGAPIVRQRFGDSNQAIYHKAGASGAITDIFPGPHKEDLPNSFRFGQKIADLAAPLGVCPQPLVGRGPTKSRIVQSEMEGVLFLFTDESIGDVLPAYAKQLIASFSPESLARGDFRAVAGVHRAEKDDHLPRFMGHYAPTYDPDVSGKHPKPATLAQYLARARLSLDEPGDTHPIVNGCADGVLALVKRAGGEIPFSLRKSSHRYVLEILQNAEIRVRYFSLLDFLINVRCRPSPEAWAAQIVPEVLVIAEAILGQKIKSQNEFLAWGDEKEEAQAIAMQKDTNIFQYPNDDPKVSIRLGSIHGVKGETHTATLVLESYHQTHHLKALIKWLTGQSPKSGADNTGEKDALKDRLKLHYVAMTRPSHLLCLAMRKDAFSAKQLELVKKRGWQVIECQAPPVTEEA